MHYNARIAEQCDRSRLSHSHHGGEAVKQAVEPELEEGCGVEVEPIGIEASEDGGDEREVSGGHDRLERRRLYLQVLLVGEARAGFGLDVGCQVDCGPSD